MISLDLPQLIVKSNLVVQARLTDKSSIRWNGHVWTKLIFSVDNFLKGDGPSTIQVMQPGGRIGNQITAVAGTRVFNINNSYCLFLWAANNQDAWQIIGLSQGTFKVNRVGTDWLINSDRNNYSLFVPTILRSQLKVQLTNKNSRLHKLKQFYAKQSIENLKSLIQTYE